VMESNKKAVNEQDHRVGQMSELLAPHLRPHLKTIEELTNRMFIVPFAPSMGGTG